MLHIRLGSILLIFAIAFFGCENTSGSGNGSAIIDDNPVIDGIKIGDVVPNKGTLVWRDEFTGSSLDMTKWNYETGMGMQYDPNLFGWGNMEKQWYHQDNVRVADGKLIIEAQKQSPPIDSMHFTSGRITTAGVLSPDGTTTTGPKYITPKTGYVEARLKSPTGAGFWPCFWLAGANWNEYSGFERMFWPACGEVDIFEADGAHIHTVGQTIHYGTQYPDQYWFLEHKTTTVPHIGENYHVYGFGWNNSVMHFYINDQLTQTIVLPLPQEAFGANTAAFYDGPGFGIIFCLALGGWYLGRDETPVVHDIVPSDAVLTGENWEARSFMVDWVRVYEGYNGEPPIASFDGVIEDFTAGNIFQNFINYGNGYWFAGYSEAQFVNSNRPGASGTRAAVYYHQPHNPVYQGFGRQNITPPMSLTGYTTIEFYAMTNNPINEYDFALLSSTQGTKTYRLSFAAANVWQLIEIPISALDITDISTFTISVWSFNVMGGDTEGISQLWIEPIIAKN